MLKPISLQVHADSAHQRGLMGKDIGIAFLDTGLFPHKDFSPISQRITAFADFVNGRISCYDDNGHGTHITGIAASSGLIGNSFLGIAPKSNIISVKVLDSFGNGIQSSFLQGLEWIHQNYKKYNIRVVNISIGTADTDADESSNKMLLHVNQLWDDGLIVCIAGGNRGPSGQTITVPGNSRKIITVGASDDSMKIIGNYRFSRNYSGRGPTKSCIMKPDVVAPGTNIFSCGFGNQYTIKSGTSMAAPVVSGAMALLLEKYPYYSNKNAKMKLKHNCDKLKTPRHHQGWGQVNLQKLLDL